MKSFVSTLLADALGNAFGGQDCPIEHGTSFTLDRLKRTSSCIVFNCLSKYGWILAVAVKEINTQMKSEIIKK